ncbi:hypothetical protein Syun_018451 [Stephania yunnanensis]|uniref:Uncharacterized protein n=1 Tax=Stephania yunnanensis TaxID=152371 RepID=A0AAP0NWC8_9MAGN
MERSRPAVSSEPNRTHDISTHDSGSSEVENYRYFPEDPNSVSEDHHYFNFSIRSLLREVRRRCCLSENSVANNVDSSCKEEEDRVVCSQSPKEFGGKDLVLKAINGDKEQEEKKEVEKNEDRGHSGNALIQDFNQNQEEGTADDEN